MKNQLHWPVLILVISLLAACVPQNKIVYLQDQSKALRNQTDKTYFPDSSSQMIIHPGDNLFITVLTAENEPTMFNNGGTGPINDPYYLSYTVDPEGNVLFPYAGEIPIAGLTTVEAADKISEVLSEYVYLPNVSVKPVNNRVFILGEVAAPGTYNFSADNINVMQALAFAGDIEEFGNRNRVMVMRTEGDTILKKYLDLTDDTVINSPYFTLQSNDILYVEPLKRRRIGITEIPYNLIFATLNTTLLVFTLLISIYNI